MMLGEQDARLQLCWGPPKLDQETRAQLLSCLVRIGDPTPVHHVQSLALSQRQE